MRRVGQVASAVSFVLLVGLAIDRCRNPPADVAALTCPPWLVVQAVAPDGKVTCGDPMCPVGQAVIHIDPNGDITCGVPKP